MPFFNENSEGHMSTDSLSGIFISFLSSRPHQHASEEVLASIDLLWDELSELEPKEQELLMKSKEMVQRCKICSNSLQKLDIRFKSLVPVG